LTNIGHEELTVRKMSTLAFAGLIFALTMVANDRSRSESLNDPAAPGRLTEEDRVVFTRRFTRSIWPMIAAPDDLEKGCIACHRDDESNVSPLVLDGHPSAVFARLLADGYFDQGYPSSVLSRVANQKPRYRMPPVPAMPWSKAEIETLKEFVADLTASRSP
jgi:hypothetical protein